MLPLINHDPGFGRSEVVIICPDIWFQKFSWWGFTYRLAGKSKTTGKHGALKQRGEPCVYTFKGYTVVYLQYTWKSQYHAVSILDVVLLLDLPVVFFSCSFACRFPMILMKNHLQPCAFSRCQGATSRTLRTPSKASREGPIYRLQ